MKQGSTHDDTSGRFFHKKSLGQNFLTSAVVPNWMCDAALLVPGDTVLEIGPGTGALTAELLKREVRVIAIEADLRAVAALEETFTEAIATTQLTLIHGDIKDIPPDTLPLTTHNYVVVANIPYYLSGFLLRQHLSGAIQPKTLVFLMQKELVARIARAEKESLLSLSVKAFGSPKYVKTVSRGHFHPQPNVDSAILAVTAIHDDHFKTLTRDFFFSLLHIGLGKKRKQLVTNLSEHYEREVVLSIFTTLGLTATVRGEDVTLPIWLRLAESLSIITPKLPKNS